jgi:excisionase family DNA binding protein
MSDYLTVKEVGERLRLSERTIRAWVASGKLRVQRLSRRCIRVEARELERFLAERTR